MVISSVINYFSNILSFPGVDAKPCFIKTFKVFVYGTLKRNEPNNDWLTNPRNGVATFIAEAKTAKRYPMIIATKYHMPFMINLPGRGCVVDGEIYEVNVPMLGVLDKKLDPKVYIREEIDISIRLETGHLESMRCHVFFLNSTFITEELLNHRNMGKYCTNGRHGKPYIKHEDSAEPEDLLEPLKY